MAYATLNIGVIGRAGVGKTTLISMNTRTQVSGQYVDYGITWCPDGHVICEAVYNFDERLTRHKSIRKKYYARMDAMILMVDLAEKARNADFSYEMKWIEEIRKYCLPDTKIIMIGNKYDLVNDHPNILDIIHEFVREYNLTYYPSSMYDRQTLINPVEDLLTDLYDNLEL